VLTSTQPEDDHIYPHSPADGLCLGPAITPSRAKDVDVAIEKATAAQPGWSATSFSKRRRLLKTLLHHVLSYQGEIVKACCLDSGKTKVDACLGEILVTVEKLQWTIKHGENALKPSRRPTNLLMCYKENTVMYEPLGVVAACVSWNYPFHNFISPVISALFSGNAIVVKPSEQTAWSSAYFLEIIRGALIACGHSPDLVQSAVCWPDTADHLTSHAGLSHITFIGSRPVAFKVCASAAKVLTPVTVELGGKDPAIILDDSTTIRKLEQVASILMRGVFQSAGQNCIGIERIIALPGVHDKLIDIVLPKIKAMKLGHPLHGQGQQGTKLAKDEATATPDMGAMISARSFAIVEDLINQAVAAGAILHCGGSRYHHPSFPNGTYFTPTLLSNVDPTMKIAQVELFAPIFLLMRASSINQAIEIANSTPYALGASVFGHNRTNTDRCIREIKAGMVSVNDFGSYYATSLPFGGIEGSGYGRFGGEEGLRSLCNVKAVCEDVRWARWLGISTQIPGLLQYPIQNGAAAWEMCKGIVGLGYGIGIRAKMRGLVQLVRA
jgi:acyl-CoA reductase-like NAD-dependent aldehyde dehydrogenase